MKICSFNYWKSTCTCVLKGTTVLFEAQSYRQSLCNLLHWRIASFSVHARVLSIRTSVGGESAHANFGMTWKLKVPSAVKYRNRYFSNELWALPTQLCRWSVVGSAESRLISNLIFSKALNQRLNFYKMKHVQTYSWLYCFESNFMFVLPFSLKLINV